jgi:glucosamine 6-phosphate synthetase-like amidotransferase/phosphosugar isomerase protein
MTILPCRFWRPCTCWVNLHESTIAQVALGLASQIRQIARELAHGRDLLYLGSGTSYPVALEGAVKLKEISYIHAEGCAAGGRKPTQNERA